MGKQAGKKSIFTKIGEELVSGGIKVVTEKKDQRPVEIKDKEKE